MHLRGLGYALAASLLFGLGAVLAQLTGKEIDATIVAILALAIGGLLLVTSLVFTRIPSFKATLVQTAGGLLAILGGVVVSYTRTERW